MVHRDPPCDHRLPLLRYGRLQTREASAVRLRSRGFRQRTQTMKRCGECQPHRAPLSLDLYYLRSTRSSSSAQQVNDQNHQTNNQKQVDQTAADMQTEPQKPQDQKNYENRPKHCNLLSHTRNGSHHVHMRTVSRKQMRETTTVRVAAAAAPSLKQTARRPRSATPTSYCSL